MKQITLTTVLISILTIGQVIAQCKKEKDDFSNETVIYGEKSIEFTKGPYGGTMHNLFKFVKNSDDDYTLSIEFFPGSIIEQEMSESSLIQFKLSDDSVLNIYTGERVIPTKKLDYYIATSVYNIKASLTKEDMEQLSKSSWEAIRFNIDKPYDYKPHGMQKKTLKKIATCLLSM